MACKSNGLRAGLIALGITIGLLAPTSALAAGGGVSAGGGGKTSSAPPPPTTTTPTPTACSIGGGGVGDGNTCAPTAKAKLLPTGYAIPPANAPVAVQRAINWGNEIVNLPYRLGGGHRLPWRLDTAYDCSGTVSWALHGAHLLSSPLPSGSFSHWGVAGPGRWISVYYNAGHAWMTIAGLRLDTALVPGNGPGWSTKMSESVGAFRVRHAPGL